MSEGNSPDFVGTIYCPPVGVNIVPLVVLEGSKREAMVEYSTGEALQ